MKNATRSTHSKERYILAYQMIKKEHGAYNVSILCIVTF